MRDFFLWGHLREDVEKKSHVLWSSLSQLKKPNCALSMNNHPAELKTFFENDYEFLFVKTAVIYNYLIFHSDFIVFVDDFTLSLWSQSKMGFICLLYYHIKPYPKSTHLLK